MSTLYTFVQEKWDRVAIFFKNTVLPKHNVANTYNFIGKSMNQGNRVCIWHVYFSRFLASRNKKVTKPSIDSMQL